MPPYTGPNKERGSYQARFIRVDDKLYESHPTIDRDHRGLAQDEGILGELQRRMQTNPFSVDAGYFRVSNLEQGPITIFRDSMTLGLPVSGIEEEVRTKTVEVFQAFSPAITIIDVERENRKRSRR